MVAYTFVDHLVYEWRYVVLELVMLADATDCLSQHRVAATSEKGCQLHVLVDSRTNAERLWLLVAALRTAVPAARPPGERRANLGQFVGGLLPPVAIGQRYGDHHFDAWSRGLAGAR